MVERLAGAEGVRHTLTLSPSSEDTAIVLVAGWEEGCRMSPTWESAGNSHVRWQLWGAQAVGVGVCAESS